MPPLAETSVPANVIAPAVPELGVKPVVPALKVETPVPAGVPHVPSPRQKVDDVAEVPLFKFVTGRLPVTPVVSGNPVAFVSVTLVGVPSKGVTNVGDVDSTTDPVPIGARLPSVPALLYRM